jgi:hypothetical protein
MSHSFLFATTQRIKFIRSCESNNKSFSILDANIITGLELST